MGTPAFPFTTKHLQKYISEDTVLLVRGIKFISKQKSKIETSVPAYYARMFPVPQRNYYAYKIYMLLGSKPR